MISEEKILLAELAAEIVLGHELSADQEKTFQDLLAKYPESKVHIKKMIQEGTLEVPYEVGRIDVDKEWTRFQAQRPVQTTTKKLVFNKQKLAWLSAAAAVLLLVFFFLRPEQSNKDYIVADKVYGQKNDVLPGKSGAFLEIEGEAAVSLNDIKDSLFVKDGLLARNNILIYKGIYPDGNPKHTLSIPIRATYEVILSDGTKAWVNAGSKISYLANFSKDERRVYLEGQAYFSVAKDANRPFIVESKGVAVQAVGTEFDVNSYNEAFTVKLIEGKVVVAHQAKDVLLKAGEEVELIDQSLKVGQIRNMEEALAWKNGYFYFDNKNLHQILDEVKRWYGIDISFIKKTKQTRYFGSISKHSSLAEVCNVLKDLTNYNFRIEDDHLFVE